MLKRDEIVRNQELVFHSADLDFEIEKKNIFCSFWLIFYPLDPDPLICIFFGF